MAIFGAVQELDQLLLVWRRGVHVEPGHGAVMLAFGRICGVKSEHGVGLSELWVGFHGLADRFDAAVNVKQIEFIVDALFVEAARFFRFCGDWNRVRGGGRRFGVRGGRERPGRFCVALRSILCIGRKTRCAGDDDGESCDECLLAER